jgi:hypothetical protein
MSHIRKRRYEPDPDLPDPGRMDRLRAKISALVTREVVSAKREAERAAKAKARLAIAGTPGGMVSEAEDFEPDFDDPNRQVKRTRRYDPLRRMDLDPALFVAAERFRDAHALAEGAREGVGAARLEAWQRCHYAARVADARAEVRDSIQAVGLRLGAVFVAAVVAYQPVRAMERELGMRSGSGADLIRDALERLRDFQSGIC